MYIHEAGGDRTLFLEAGDNRILVGPNPYEDRADDDNRGLPAGVIDKDPGVYEYMLDLVLRKDSPQAVALKGVRNIEVGIVADMPAALTLQDESATQDFLWHLAAYREQSARNGGGFHTQERAQALLESLGKIGTSEIHMIVVMPPNHREYSNTSAP